MLALPAIAAALTRDRTAAAEQTGLCLSPNGLGQGTSEQCRLIEAPLHQARRM